MSELKKFLAKIATDPKSLSQFQKNPEDTMKKAGLSSDDIEAITTGNTLLIHDRLSENPQGLTLVPPVHINPPITITPPITVPPINPPVNVWPVNPPITVPPINPPVNVWPVNPPITVPPINPPVNIWPVNPPVNVFPPFWNWR